MLPVIRRLARVVVLLAALLLAAPAASPAQGALPPPGVRIRVVDPSGVPVRDARVTAVGVGAEAVSGDSGWVRLPGVPPGRVAVRVARIGFWPAELRLEVPATGRMEVEVELEPAPVAVQGVTAVAKPELRALQAAGFYRRREAGGGHFMAREEIERSGAARTSELFRRVQGVRVVPAGGGGYVLQSVRYGATLSGRPPPTAGAGLRRSGSAGGAVCDMLVFVDGVRVRRSIDDVRLQSLEAVEVFRGPSQVPPEYNLMDAACGVVLLWTRSGG